jgi:zinc transport system substrate-binding protein
VPILKNTEVIIVKKILPIALALCLALTLAACGNTPAGDAPSASPIADNTPADAESIGKISVVTTIFPPYDFTRAIVGNMADVAMLLPPASESHSYEPTPQDIIKIQNCDVFIYNGGDSDAWVDDVLASMDTSKMKIVKFIDCVEIVEEEIVEGMEDDEHEHGEVDLDAVEDRPLSDFSGDWQDCGPYLKDGTVDAYFEHYAEESGMTPEDVKAFYIQLMRTDYPTLAITANSISVGGAAANATYKGYEIVEGENGPSVWYKYETDGTAGVPKYWLFNDHGYTAGVPDEEIPHIHAIYNDESFEALLAIENWAAMYFSASVTGDEILEVMLGHNHEDEEEEEHEHGEIDEHVWTSPRNAKLIVERISDALCGTDPANAVAYKQNAEAYEAKLDELDAKFQAVVNSAARKTIVFGDRFPFRYFADTYGLDYFAAFPGCSTETEPSTATVAFLIDKVKAEQIPVVFHIELSNAKMSDTIAEETGAKVLELHACHNISKADFEAGKTYIDIMTANVDALKEALN